jgi:putative hydrolase of HD superfamily
MKWPIGVIKKSSGIAESWVYQPNTDRTWPPNAQPPPSGGFFVLKNFVCYSDYMNNPIHPIVDFLYEVGILARTPRSGFHFLGSGSQSVAEHGNRSAYIGYVLASMEKDVDSAKVLKMCLFHDLSEARTSDLNYVHQKYAQADHGKAVTDIANSLEFGDDIKSTIDEYEERTSKESILAKDADNLEWIISLKEQVDIGNKRAEEWIPSAIKRLKTESAKNVAAGIMQVDSNHWWFSDKEGEWWVSRNKKK